MQEQATAIHHTLCASPEDARGRLDAWLAARTPLSRARIQSLMEAGCVSVDGVAVSEPSRKVRPGMRVEIVEPPPVPTETLPQDIPIPVVYEDADLLVLDKPAGLVVHPAPGHADGTLVNALLHHCGDLPGIGGEQRPGIVHRLDRDTSGLMVVAKSETAMRGLVALFQSGAVRKVYQALVHGIPVPPSGRIETRIGRSPRDRKRMAVLDHGGRPAISEYRIVESFPARDVAWVAVRIETGRTHQIRVHLQHIGHPVCGDPVYGNARRDRALGIPSERQLLHAWQLSFLHPVTQQPLSFEAPLPPDFATVLEALPS